MDEIKNIYLLFYKDDEGNTAFVNAYADRDVCEQFKGYYETNYPNYAFQIIESVLIEKKHLAKATWNPLNFTDK